MIQCFHKLHGYVSQESLSFQRIVDLLHGIREQNPLIFIQRQNLSKTFLNCLLTLHFVSSLCLIFII